MQQQDRGTFLRTSTGTLGHFDIVFPKQHQRLQRLQRLQRSRGSTKKPLEPTNIHRLIDTGTVKALVENIAVAGEIMDKLGAGQHVSNNALNNGTMAPLGKVWSIRINAAPLVQALWLAVGVAEDSIAFQRLRRLIRKFGMSVSMVGWNLLLSKIQDEGLLLSSHSSSSNSGGGSSTSTNKYSSTSSVVCGESDFFLKSSKAAEAGKDSSSSSSSSNSAKKARFGETAGSSLLQTDGLDDAALRVIRLWVENRDKPRELVKTLEKRLKATRAWDLAQEGLIVLEHVCSSMNGFRVHSRLKPDALVFPRLQSTFVHSSRNSDGIYFDAGFNFRKNFAVAIEGGVYPVGSPEQDVGAVGVTVNVQKIIKWNLEKLVSKTNHSGSGSSGSGGSGGGVSHGGSGGDAENVINLVFVCAVGSNHGVDLLVDRLRSDGIRALCGYGEDPSMEGQILMAQQVGARFMVEICRDESFKMIDHLVLPGSPPSKKKKFKEITLLLDYVRSRMGMGSR